MGFFRPKTFVWIAVIMGFITAIVLLAGGVYMGTTFISEQGSTDENAFMYSLLSGFVCALGANNFVRCILMARFLNKNDDEAVAVNRYAIIVLMLNVSSFYLPLILRAFRPVGTTSDPKEPVRFNLGKWFSSVALFDGIVFFAASMGFIADHIGFNTAFSNMATYQYGVLLVAILFAFEGLKLVGGLLAFPAFYAKGAYDAYLSKKGFMYHYIAFFAIMFTIAATFLLIFAILSAILEIINSFLRVFESNNNGWFGALLSIIMLPLIIAYQGFIIYNCLATIKGIWSKDNVVVYKQYDPLLNQRPNQGIAAN